MGCQLTCKSKIENSQTNIKIQCRGVVNQTSFNKKQNKTKKKKQTKYLNLFSERKKRKCSQNNKYFNREPEQTIEVFLAFSAA